MDEVLHSQFKLDRLKYRDTNNFVRFNEVVVNDDMWAMQKEKPFHFLNYKQNPVFEAETFIIKETVSTDGG